ncbi:phage portal protein [Sporosarcina sp. Marseille-Q4943]|uniref:phage tail assembly chaperone n=1 Tax=Sporosarcina sp. Marseille-Q4943 TaxID=2942204 RepID=UPI00208DAA8E|nr:phage portal protein [Sporosarcina sp. Marseille-Q4943]
MTNQDETLAKVYDLSFFMPGKAEEAEEVKHPISKRFKDKEGNIIPFVFKPVATERIDEIEQLHTKPVFEKGRKVGENVDNARFMAQLAVESTIYPDFKSVEFRQAYKTEDPIEVAKRVLHVGGEYAAWIKKASDINGFDDSLEELEEAIKN